MSWVVLHALPNSLILPDNSVFFYIFAMKYLSSGDDLKELIMICITFLIAELESLENILMNKQLNN
jgi:hypothetical protein